MTGYYILCEHILSYFRTMKVLGHPLQLHRRYRIDYAGIEVFEEAAAGM